ncbi:MAG: hypothetical protein ACREFZ_03340 [Acetobacteraceae bacterium]
MPDGRRYGYHWNLGAVGTNDSAGGVRWEETVSAIGNAGQRLFLLPRRDLAVVVTAGNYGAPDQSGPLQAVVRDVLPPAMRGWR